MLESLSFAGAVILALVHMFGGKIDALHGSPRSRWLSFGGGVAVAYAFVHFLPELSDLQKKVEEQFGGSGHWYWNHHLYLVGLAGLALFYSLEIAAKKSKERRDSGEERASTRVFWPHMGVMLVYNAFIGYIFIEEASSSVAKLGTFLVVLAPHFVVNDRALHNDYASLYTRIGRWILSAAVILGWAYGRFWKLPEIPYGIILAVLAGGIIFNAIKEELPQDQEGNIWPFLVGAVGCGLALALIR